MAPEGTNQTSGSAISYPVLTRQRKLSGRCPFTLAQLGSRCPQLQLNATSVSSVIPSWLIQVLKGYEQDTSAQKLLSKLATREKLDHYTLTQGIIRFKGRIWLGMDREIQRLVMSELH
jgi:hypothetical protein